MFHGNSIVQELRAFRMVWMIGLSQSTLLWLSVEASGIGILKVPV